MVISINEKWNLSIKISYKNTHFPVEPSVELTFQVFSKVLKNQKCTTGDTCGGELLAQQQPRGVTGKPCIFGVAVKVLNFFFNTIKCRVTNERNDIRKTSSLLQIAIATLSRVQ